MSKLEYINLLIIPIPIVPIENPIIQVCVRIYTPRKPSGKKGKTNSKLQQQRKIYKEFRSLDNYFGFHSSFLAFIIFRASRCFSSKRVFSVAAPSISPDSNFRTSV